MDPGSGPKLEIASRSEDGRHTITPVGDLDIFTAPHVRRAVEAAQAAHDDVVLDLGGIDFIDSTGLQALIEVARMRHAPALVNPSETVRKLVALTGSGLVLGI